MIKLKKKQELEEISAASMSDIAFLLLVFFMVTAVFFVKEGLNISLPRKQSEPQPFLRKNVYEILVTQDRYKMRNTAFGTKEYSSLKEFRDDLNQMEIPDLKNKLALIVTTGDTKYAKMLDALSAVQLRGFEKISVRKKK
ncbi:MULTISPECIES: ExbD/TolR family protein [Leptospira]|uniref:Biopolymer transporter ExbD n=6 Tax=Leptospira TaxID=171 RepID=A0A2N0AH90_9LEPT|nr:MULTISPECIES: biopolymer transporter ExbD [Leptospira]MCW7469294.1 biopolymer transporter ExbD [Leptospira kanakyensis]MCW7480281.1 biopolymer transporter ExbD [Leptospira kanakyensis]PJZ46175.1 biopolymer transporter ExbD [Leptospira brenneri]PJZ83659.1 biopolymer transporter ExbD [Leptospira harrisiae]PKA06880.1 biopolymer transporter ExbD [Leptospira harrisiae]